MGKLDGKVALVTGSGRNIGRATVLKLAGEGADVVVNARSNQEEAEAVAEEARALGVKALSILADVARKEQVDSMVAMAMARSEEHTSELQSRTNLVCRLLLEKKNKKINKKKKKKTTKRTNRNTNDKDEIE